MNEKTIALWLSAEAKAFISLKLINTKKKRAINSTGSFKLLGRITFKKINRWMAATTRRAVADLDCNCTLYGH